MTSLERTATVAVGVGGAGGQAAPAWAVEEAERAGARLVLVRVCPPGSPLDRLAGEPHGATGDVPAAVAAGAHCTVALVPEVPR